MPTSLLVCSISSYTFSRFEPLIEKLRNNLYILEHLQKSDKKFERFLL